MPIYEYSCQDCQTEFEQLRRIKDADSGIICTHCHGENIKRKISLFNATSGGRTITNSGSGCSGCAGGSCSSCGS